VDSSCSISPWRWKWWTTCGARPDRATCGGSASRCHAAQTKRPRPDGCPGLRVRRNHCNDGPGRRMAARELGNPGRPGKLDGTVALCLPARQRICSCWYRRRGLALAERGAGIRVTPNHSSDQTRASASLMFDGAAATLLFEPGDPTVARLFDAALVLDRRGRFSAAHNIA